MKEKGLHFLNEEEEEEEEETGRIRDNHRIDSKELEV